jgi:hypothetical protein
MNNNKVIKELEEYNLRYAQDIENNYGIEKEDDDTMLEKNIALATLINTQYDKAIKTDINMLRNLAITCMSDKRVKHILLAHELNYLKVEPKQMNLTDFGRCAKSILDRYQCKAGGFLIEDMEWTLHTYKSKEHNIKKHELVFENSVDKLDIDVDDTQIYLDQIERRLNKISTNISVTIHYKTSKSDKLVWILIWCVDKQLKKINPKIKL